MAAPDVSPIVVPDHFTVWACSDVHGQLAAVDRLLARAGLSDGADAWTAPPGTALVVTGDIVDRGREPLGLVRRLASLRTQAATSGGLVALLEGNHEVQVLGGLGGEPEIFRALMTFGGAATLLSAGLRPDEWQDRQPAAIAARVVELAPDLLPTLWTFAPYARWRDVLFVHGGPVPFRDLAGFERGAERIWIRESFFESPHPFPEADAWAAYRGAGLRRVVYGHTSMERPTLGHGGRTLNVDTWRGGQVTLARIGTGPDLADTAFIAEPSEPRAVDDAPVTRDEVRRFDTLLPPRVEAWVAAVRG